MKFQITLNRQGMTCRRLLSCKASFSLNSNRRHLSLLCKLLHGFSWGDRKKCLFTVQRELIPPKPRLVKPRVLGDYVEEHGELKAGVWVP